MVNVLFVCLGNICRSPAAEGVFRARVAHAGLAGRIGVDSAGTHAFHVGKPPDPRTLSAGRRRGLDLSDLRGRRAEAADFHRFDYVLAMDADNLADLERLRPAAAPARVQLFLDYAPAAGVRHVPDPYGEGPAAFEAMFDLIEAGAQGLLDHLRRAYP